MQRSQLSSPAPGNQTAPVVPAAATNAAMFVHQQQQQQQQLRLQRTVSAPSGAIPGKFVE